MSCELVTDAEYDSLPEDPQLRFVAYEAICRRRMTEILIADSRSEDADEFLRLQYMAQVTGAAEALGIDSIVYPTHLEHPIRGFDEFMLDANRASARIRVANATSKAYSVRLSEGTRGKIEKQIRILRRLITESDIKEDKRERLLSRLDDLSTELSQPRVSFAKVMTVLAAVAVAVNQGTSFLANAPHAIATITSLLGQDKLHEDAEAARLGAPPKPKALPAPKSARHPPRHIATRRNDVIDDDIPF